jgi:hypothetical protein
MTIAQKRRFALIKNAGGDEIGCGLLLMTEKQLWDLVGDHGISDKETVQFAMSTVYQAAELMLNAGWRRRWLLRVELLAPLNSDTRYQYLIGTIVDAIRTEDREAILAAQLTALCASLMMSPRQHIWPREWNSPTYKTNSVWQPYTRDIQDKPSSLLTEKAKKEMVTARRDRAKTSPHDLRVVSGG